MRKAVGLGVVPQLAHRRQTRGRGRAKLSTQSMIARTRTLAKAIGRLKRDQIVTHTPQMVANADQVVALIFMADSRTARLGT